MSKLILTLIFSFGAFAQSNAQLAMALCKQLAPPQNIKFENPVKVGAPKGDFQEWEATVVCSTGEGFDDVTLAEFQDLGATVSGTGYANFVQIEGFRYPLKTESAVFNENFKTPTTTTTTNNSGNDYERISRTCLLGKANKCDKSGCPCSGDYTASLNNGVYTLFKSNGKGRTPTGYTWTIGPNSGVDTKGHWVYQEFTGDANCSGSCSYNGQSSAAGIAKACLRIKRKKFGRKAGAVKKVVVRNRCLGMLDAYIASDGAVVISMRGSGNSRSRSSDDGYSEVRFRSDNRGRNRNDSDDISYNDDADDFDDFPVRRPRRGGFVWINDNERCAYSRSWQSECLNRARYGDILDMDGNILHCVDCSVRGGRRGGGQVITDVNGLGAWGRSAGGILSGVGSILGPVSQGLFGYLGAKQYAGAMKYSAEQCAQMQIQMQQQGFDYLQTNGLTDRDMPGGTCNGMGMAGFAGGQGFVGNGFGGFGQPGIGAGYTGGFIGGAAGPYGHFNPYGSPFGGGVNVGIGAGFPGGGVQCITFPCPGGGLGGGIGFGGGLNVPGGSVWPGQFGGGFGGGQFGGGFGGGQFGGGFGGGQFGGLGVGGVPWGQQGGAYGQFGGGGFQQQNWGAMQSNQQAQAQGSYFQQAALAGQVQNAGQNYANYGASSFGGYSPAYSPFNIGFTAGFGGGW